VVVTFPTPTYSIAIEHVIEMWLAIEHVIELWLIPSLVWQILAEFMEFPEKE
jgi:hypothetical protein